MIMRDMLGREPMVGDYIYLIRYNSLSLGRVVKLGKVYPTAVLYNIAQNSKGAKGYKSSNYRVTTKNTYVIVDRYTVEQYLMEEG